MLKLTIASGGEAAANGEYPDAGTYNSARYYAETGGGAFAWWDGSSDWLNGPTLGGATVWYRGVGGDIDNPPEGIWAQVDGAFPAPIVSVEDVVELPAPTVKTITSSSFVVHSPATWGETWDSLVLLDDAGAVLGYVTDTGQTISRTGQTANTDFSLHWVTGDSSGDELVDSEASEVTDFATAPTMGTVTDVTASAATVTAPTPLPAAVDDLTLQISESGAGIWTDAETGVAAAQEVAVSALDAETAYDVRWKANLLVAAGPDGEDFAFGTLASFTTDSDAPPPPWPTEGGQYGSCTRLKAGDVINFTRVTEDTGIPVGSYANPLSPEDAFQLAWLLTNGIDSVVNSINAVSLGWGYEDHGDGTYTLTVPEDPPTGQHRLTTFIFAPFPIGSYFQEVGCFYFSNDYANNPAPPAGALEHYISGGIHYFRATSPATLPTGATKFKLKRTITGGGATAYSSAVAVSTAATVAHSTLTPCIISWVAVNDADEVISESDPVIADLAGLFASPMYNTISTQSGLLPPQPDPVDPDLITLSPTSITLDGTGFSFSDLHPYYPAESGNEDTFLVLSYIDDAGAVQNFWPTNPPPAVNSSGNVGFSPHTIVSVDFSLANAWATNALNPVLRVVVRRVSERGATYSAPVNLTVATPLVYPAAPIITITGSTTATVSAVTFDDTWASLEFRYYRVAVPGTVLTGDMTDGEDLDLTGLIEGQPYLGYFRAYDEDGGYVDSGTTPFTPTGTGGDTPVTTAPSAPGELVAIEIQDVYALVDLPALPANADSLRIVKDASGTITAADVVTVAGSTRKILNLTASTAYVFRAQAVNTFGTALGPPLEIKTRATATAAAVPNKPAPPFAASLLPVKIGTSGWQTGVTSMKLFKGSTLVATFTSTSDRYTDATATDGDVYTVKAVNSAGESVLSDPFTLSLASTKLSLAWNTPAAAASLAGKQLLSFTATGTITDPRIEIRGLSAGTPALNETTGRYALRIDTKDFAQGSAELKAVGTGSDGLQATATRTVVFANTLRNGVLYDYVSQESPPPDGQVWTEAGLKCERPPINPVPSRQYWIRTALATTEPTVAFDTSDDNTAEERAAAFDELRAVVLSEPREFDPDTYVVKSWAGLLVPPGDAVYWVFQWTPAQLLRHYLTGCERVAKIRQFDAGEWLVFADSPVGADGAKVFIFDGTSLAETVDLSDHDAAGASDAARLADKVWVVAGGELFAVDLDTNDRTVNVAPRGDARTPLFVERAGSKIYALLVDAEAAEEATNCYDMTYQAPRLSWTIDEPATLCFSDDTDLYVAAGLKLYKATGTTVTLLQAFSANITAISVGMVGLSNGDVWRLQGTAWTKVLNGTDAITAVSAWEGVELDPYGVAGTDSPQLLEEARGGTWSDARTIEPGSGMTETIDGITALARFEKDVSGEDGESDSIIAMMIGSRGSGVFSVLEETQLSTAQGAFLASGIDVRRSIDAFAGPEV